MKKKNRKGKREFLFDDLVVLSTNEINSSRTQLKQTLSKKEVKSVTNKHINQR